jgi:hypothetical protein
MAETKHLSLELPVPNRSAVFHRIILRAILIDESVHVTKFWRAKF